MSRRRVLDEQDGFETVNSYGAKTWIPTTEYAVSRNTRIVRQNELAKRLAAMAQSQRGSVALTALGHSCGWRSLKRHPQLCCCRTLSR